MDAAKRKLGSAAIRAGGYPNAGNNECFGGYIMIFPTEDTLMNSVPTAGDRVRNSPDLQRSREERRVPPQWNSDCSGADGTGDRERADTMKPK